MNLLIRDRKMLDNVEIDYSIPIMADTETYQDPEVAKGGLYGKIRLIQIYQKEWPGAMLIDCLFVPLMEALRLLQPGHLVFHNASYDLHTINLYTDELWLPKEVDDTAYLSRLKYFTKKKFGFYDCLKYAKAEDDVIRGIDKKENQKADWGGPLSKKMKLYAECDVTYLQALYDKVLEMRTMPVYELDIFNLKYAVEYDRRGIPVDQGRVQQKLRETSDFLEKVLDKLPLNPGSSKQCCKALGTSSSDRDTLVTLSIEGNELAKDIRDARMAIKERNYLMQYSRPKIYGFHNPSAAITGRFSCTGGDRYDHVNTQQIPRRLLPCLGCPNGYVFVYKDYSGLELRMAVAWVGEPTMEQLMRDGVDLHTYTGCIIYSKTPETLTKYERMVGKILNFSLVYGAGIATVQSMLRAWGNVIVPFQEVKQLRLKWLDEYHYFNEWHTMHKNHIQVYGYLDVTTALGKTVRTYTIPDSLNTPIQGSSGEVTKTSLRMLKTRYPKENLVNTIHDSNCLVVKEDEAPHWVDALNECMVDAWEEVTQSLAIPDLPMPPEAEYKQHWEF